MSFRTVRPFWFLSGHVLPFLSANSFLHDFFPSWFLALTLFYHTRFLSSWHRLLTRTLTRMEPTKLYHWRRIMRTNTSLVGTLRRYHTFLVLPDLCPTPIPSTLSTWRRFTYPLTSRSPELWVLETNQDGLETWRSIETFLGNLRLSQDPRVIQATENQRRVHYDVQPISSSSPSGSLHPVLPHPEHSNVQFGQPVSAIPDHTFILQSCWGRSAYHHSQGPPTSLYWPPSRTTPPASPSRLLLRHSAPTHMELLSSLHQPGPPRSGLSSHADMSDSSV